MNFKFLIAMIITITLAAMSAAQVTEKLNIDQAINLALENNESYKSAKEEITKANNRIYEVRASAFPQLTAGLTVVRNWELASIVLPGFFAQDSTSQDSTQSSSQEPLSIRMGTYYNWTADVTVTQPIYNGGAVFAAWSAAKLYRKFTNYQFQQRTLDLKLDVIKAYYGVVMADELQRVAKQSVDLAQANLDVVQKMENQGTVSDFEVLMAQVRLANMKPQYIQAEAASKLAHQSLNNLIGLDLNTQLQLEFTIDSTMYLLPQYNLDSLESSALDNRPEMQMARTQTKMLKKGVSVARAGYRPSINFLTTLQFQAQYDDDRFPNRKDWARSYYSGINISIPIFDSWRTPAKVKQAKIDLSQSKLTESDLQDKLKLDVEQSWWNYMKARESITAQGKAVEMAKRGLDIARVRYENGVGTQLELFEAEVALTSAENNRVTAFYDLVTGYASLMRALGEDKLLR